MSEAGDAITLGLEARAAALASSREAARALAVDRDEKQLSGSGGASPGEAAVTAPATGRAA